MWEFIFILLIAVCTYQFWKLQNIKRQLASLKDAATNRSTFLKSQESRLAREYHLEDITAIFRDLIEKENQIRDLELQTESQITEVLGNIEQAVISTDNNNVIRYANQAALKRFSQGSRIKGKRIEAVIRNPDLLDFIIRSKNKRAPRKSEFEVILNDREFWFEVSGSQIPRTESSIYGSQLFVLHDITRLKELERVKTNFVANVSHELKTPITIIKGFTETLSEDWDNLPVETRSKFFKKIKNNTERLHLLVEDLLTLSRIETDPEFLNVGSHRIIDIFDNLKDTYIPMLSDEQELIFEDQTHDQEFQLDVFKISQVFQNLIENAIRYSGSESIINVKARIDVVKEALVCSVEDNGKGIPEQDVPHIFRRFYRVDKDRSRTSGGTGLGLSISRGIVELHEGIIYAKNLEEGGANITFEIPLGKVTQPVKS